MVTIKCEGRFGPWLSAAARASQLIVLTSTAIAAGSAAPTRQPSNVQQPAMVAQRIDELTANKLVWSSLSALDQANRTGNYSVLRDLGAPSFQANNSAATLAGIFESLRKLHFDLTNTLVVMPIYSVPPSVQGDVLRLKGIFALRPTPVGFDLLFQQSSGEWRLLGLSVVPLVRSSPPSGR